MEDLKSLDIGINEKIIEIIGNEERGPVWSLWEHVK